MSRILAADFLRAAYAAESGEFPILLLTFTHEDLSTPIRISTDPTERISEGAAEVIYGTVSNGDTYIFLPVTITLPGESDEGPSSMGLEIDNVSEDLRTTLRGIATPPSLNTDIVLNTDLDTVLASWPEYLLINISTDALIIRCELVLEILNTEPFPAGTFNPSEFPGGFAGVG